MIALIIRSSEHDKTNFASGIEEICDRSHVVEEHDFLVLSFFALSR